jgi:hypothetical protein
LNVAGTNSPLAKAAAMLKNAQNLGNPVSAQQVLQNLQSMQQQLLANNPQFKGNLTAQQLLQLSQLQAAQGNIPFNQLLANTAALGMNRGVSLNPSQAALMAQLQQAQQQQQQSAAAAASAAGSQRNGNAGVNRKSNNR